MINIICSLQDHKFRIKSKMLCCVECKQNQQNLLPFTSFTLYEQKIIQDLIQISSICEQLISIKEDYRNVCLIQWNEIICSIIDKHCIIVEDFKLRFSEKNQILLQQLQFLIGQKEVYFKQLLSQLNLQIVNNRKSPIFQKQAAFFKGHDKLRINNAKFSSDGTILVIASANMITIWNVQTKVILNQFKHDWNRYCSFEISKNNVLLAYTGDFDTDVLFRNIFDKHDKKVKSLKFLRLIQRRRAPLKMIFDQKSEYLIIGNYCERIYIYNIEKGNIDSLIANQYIKCLQLTNDNKLLSFIGEQGLVNIFSFKPNKLLIQNKQTHDFASSLCFSHRSYLLFTAGCDYSNNYGKIKIWKMVGMKAQFVKLFEINVESKQDQICCFLGDKIILSKQYFRGEIQVHQIDSRKIGQTLELQEGFQYINAL